MARTDEQKQAWHDWNKANHERVHETLRKDFPDYSERVERPGSLGERFPEHFEKK